MKRLVLIAIVAALTLMPPFILAANEQEPVGARPSAMGEAFVGIADDGNALYWNPAGMALLNHHEIAASYSDLFGIDINNSYIGYTYPVTDRLAIGVDWFNIGFKDVELDFGFNKFNAGVAYRLFKRASIGGSIKFLNTNTSFDDQSLGRGNGISGDIGILFQYSDRLSFGAAVHNLFDADITYDNGAHSRFYDMKARLGIGFSPVEDLLVGLDIGERAHLGGEYILEELLALRAGIQRDLHRDPESVYSFGVGIRYSPLQFDYSLTSYPHLSETNRFSLSLYFNFGYSLVSVNEVTTVGGDALFPSRWASYQAAPFLTFQLENKFHKPLHCDWEVTLDGMTSSPSQGQLVLRPHELQSVYVTGRFSEKFLANKADALKSGKVILTYTQGREQKTVEQEFDVFVYKSGAIDWNESTAWAASFITPEDEAVREFAMAVLEFDTLPKSSSPLLKNIITAMTVFDGLAAHGIRYLPDPNNPYDSIRQKAVGLDNVQLPALLLKSKRGDCDDLTVLLCSLLESVGIKTVVLDVPGHLFMMFDSGIPSAYRIAVQLDDDLLVEHAGNVFVPIEVTELARGFQKAWRVGAEKYKRWQQLNKITRIDLREAWQRFPSMPVTHKPSDEFGSYADQTLRLEDDLAALTEAQRRFIEYRYQSPIAGLSADPNALNQRALAEVFKGDYMSGKELFEAALGGDSSRSDIAINLANTLSLLGRCDESMDLYESVMLSGSSPAAGANHIIAACLFTDSLSGDTNRRAVVDSLVTTYAETSTIEIDNELVDRCLASFTQGSELAECVAMALNSGEMQQKTTRKSGQDGNQPIKAEVRWFQWLY